MDRFAGIANQLAATTRKLGKRAILAAYFRSLDRSDLPVAALFLTGRPFPLHDERTLDVGGGLLQEALLQLSGASEQAFQEAYIRFGDIGEVGEALLRDRAGPPSPGIADLGDFFAALASIRGPAAKREALIGMLGRLRPAALKYGVKIISAGLRIGVQESLVEEAIAEAFGVPPDDVRWANMLLGDVGEVAVLAAEGRTAEAGVRLFRPLKCMLGTAVDAVDEAFREAQQWVVDDKYDGVRAQVHVQGNEARIFSRTLDDISGQFPDVVPELAALGHELVLDGELIAHDGQRALGFAALSKRLGRKSPDDAILAEVPVRYVAFDLLYLDGQTLLREPLTGRRRQLSALGFPGRLLAPTTTVAGTEEEVEEAFEAALGRGNEGLMLKSPSSPYLPGKRGRAWLKLKRPLATLDCVIVGAEYGHGKRAGLLSDYTFAVRDGDRLAPIGKAYSGITDEELAFLSDHCKRTALKDLGRAFVVRPEIVIEVAFNGINRSRRHPAGFALRFPRIKRLRLDKSVSEVDTLDRVRAIHEATRPAAV